MKFLIQDLLDFAQKKAGKFRKVIEEFNVKDAIEEMMSIEIDKARNKGVNLHVEYVNIGNIYNPYTQIPRYSPFMKSDVGRIQQVILNLQSNALKFTSKGEFKIVVEITKCIFDEVAHDNSALYLQV